MTTNVLVHGAWHTGEPLEDGTLPASLPWHPRLSEKLGLFRYLWMPGSHELCFTDPKALCETVIRAGRD